MWRVCTKNKKTRIVHAQARKEFGGCFEVFTAWMNAQNTIGRDKNALYRGRRLYTETPLETALLHTYSRSTVSKYNFVYLFFTEGRVPGAFGRPWRSSSFRWCLEVGGRPASPAQQQAAGKRENKMSHDSNHRAVVWALLSLRSEGEYGVVHVGDSFGVTTFIHVPPKSEHMYHTSSKKSLRALPTMHELKRESGVWRFTVINNNSINKVCDPKEG